jgi:hypothetical protein
MQLPPEQTARFYRIWVALLHYVNDQQHLVPCAGYVRRVTHNEIADAIG